MIRIRRATADDEQFIKSVYKECRNELGSFDLYMCWQRFLNGKSKESYYVCPTKGFIRFGYSQKYNSFIVHDIGVLATARGQGVGRGLLKRVPLPFILKCNADNAGGNAFYASLAMDCIGTTETRLGKKQNIWKLCVAL